MNVEVRRVPAETTYSLRQQVLRRHQQIGEIRLPGDDDPDTASLAALDAGGTVVGTANVRREPCPWQPERRDAWRLRGMATTPGAQGAGIGGRVLAAVVAHVEEHGGGLLWCAARTPARAFYQRGGLAVHGAEWEEPLLGPHVHMWCDVPAGVVSD